MAAAMRGRVGFDAIMLAFKKGFWTAGKDAVDMDGEELIALVSETMFGWVKWQDKRPVDYRVGFVRDRFEPPRRDELGDDDSSQWERRGGDRVDPWVFTYFLPLVDPETGTLYIFSTTSGGGKDALADLQELYADGLELPENAGKAPLVALSGDSYPTRDYGEIQRPIFKIVAWVDRPAIKPIRPPVSAALAIGRVAAPLIEHKRNDIDDPDIPF
jgi:hypothetical protein